MPPPESDDGETPPQAGAAGDNEQIIRALAGSRFRRFHHAGKSYLAFEGGVPAFKPGTLVAPGYAVSVVADGHVPGANELAAALAALEAKRSSEGARSGA